MVLVCPAHRPGFEPASASPLRGSLRALLPYPGGKRRLVPLIFALLGEAVPRHAWPELTLLDPFLGSGAVALAAKHFGFGRVVGTDIAERSVLVGRALIANPQETLRDRETLRLLEPAPALNGTPSALIGRLPPPLAEFAENAQRHLLGGSFAGVKRDLATTLTLKIVLRAFPMSLASATDAPHLVEGSFDRISAPRLAHYLRAAQRLTAPTELLRLAAEQSAAIVPGRAEVLRADALETIATTDADVLYLDPPYPGTQTYDRAFALIDEFIGIPAAAAEFAADDVSLHRLLDAAAHIDWLLLSMGNARLTAEQLGEVVTRHRPVVRLLEIPYRHYGAIASTAKNQANREYLLLAGPPRG